MVKDNSFEKYFGLIIFTVHKCIYVSSVQSNYFLHWKFFKLKRVGSVFITFLFFSSNIPTYFEIFFPNLNAHDHQSHYKLIKKVKICN